jgi:hypothetical protein
MSGAGHQHLLGFMKQLVRLTTREQVGAALFAQLTSEDEGPSLRWDPQDDRRYALRWKEPSGDKIRYRAWGEPSRGRRSVPPAVDAGGLWAADHRVLGPWRAGHVLDLADLGHAHQCRRRAQPCGPSPDTPTGRPTRNAFLVTYDIREEKRLAKVHKIMRGFGDHLSYGYGECAAWAALVK